MMTRDTTHLVALHEGLAREKARLAETDTQNARAREMRQVWIAQREREIAAEMTFLGMSTEPVDNISDDELLSELEAI